MSDERIERQFQVSGSPRIRIENVNGSVNVKPGPDGEVSIIAVRSGRLNGHTRIEIDQDPDGTVNARAKVNTSDFFLRGLMLTREEVHFEVTVPAHSDVIARVVNSVIDLGGISGCLDLNTVNGRVTAHDLSGEIKIRTVNGTITGTRISGPADLKSVNGKIQISESNLPVLNANTVNGRLELETPIGEGPYHLHTVNGNVELTSADLPAGRVHFSSVAGRLKVDGKVMRSGKDAFHHGPMNRTIDLGNGGPEIYFKSVSGSLAFKTGASGASTAAQEPERPDPNTMDILHRIARGELSVDQGLAEMKQ